MRMLKSNFLFKLVNSYSAYTSKRSNFSYVWIFFSVFMLWVCLTIQIITGVTLATHYNPSVLEAFLSSTAWDTLLSLMKSIFPMFLGPDVLEAFSNKAMLTVSVTILIYSNPGPEGPGLQPPIYWQGGRNLFILFLNTLFFKNKKKVTAVSGTNYSSIIPWFGFPPQNRCVPTKTKFFFVRACLIMWEIIY